MKYQKHRAPRTQNPSMQVCDDLMFELRVKMEVTLVNRAGAAGGQGGAGRHAAPADVRRTWTEMAQGRERPAPAGRQGAAARLQAAAGWNRSGRKLGRCLGFRSDASRGRPGEKQQDGGAQGGARRAPLGPKGGDRGAGRKELRGALGNMLRCPFVQPRGPFNRSWSEKQAAARGRRALCPRRPRPGVPSTPEGPTAHLREAAGQLIRAPGLSSLRLLRPANQANLGVFSPRQRENAAGRAGRVLVESK